MSVINGKIKGIQYEIVLADNLEHIDIENFNINKVPSCCLLKDGQYSFAISKWVSPKRTRSYPFERVYNTLNTSKKITVIPIVKDEGIAGDRDFIQWDTISLMSLLDVFVILGYYYIADIKGKKITNQQFNNEYIISQIKKIEKYHSSALHWNLNELKNNLHNVTNKAQESYCKIEKQTGIALHSLKGLDDFKHRISKDISEFMKFSRDKAQQAQIREVQTLQPKESLSTLSKAQITINNYLGGQYFLTVDEILINKNTLFLIESKHSINTQLPSKGDIKDGLLKMILYNNLSDVEIDGKKINIKPVLKLTSTLLKGSILSSDNGKRILAYCTENKLSKRNMEIIEKLFTEAYLNNFIVKIEHSV